MSGKRFTPYEAVDRPMLMVQKKDGSYEPFDRHKLVTGIFNAIKKRPVNSNLIVAMVEELEDEYSRQMRSTVTSSEIGNAVMDPPPSSSESLAALSSSLEWR